jgi:hypothetical protein
MKYQSIPIPLVMLLGPMFVAWAAATQAAEHPGCSAS